MKLNRCVACIFGVAFGAQSARLTSHFVRFVEEEEEEFNDKFNISHLMATLIPQFFNFSDSLEKSKTKSRKVLVQIFFPLYRSIVVQFFLPFI